MRLALALTFLLGALMTSLFFVLPTREPAQSTPPLERGQKPDDRKSSFNTSLIDFRESRGRHLFAPRFEEVLLDGTRETYQALLLWCDGLGPEGEARFEVSDARALIVTAPKTRAEFVALPSIPLDTPPALIGAEISRLLELHGSGFKARRAVFSGGRDVASASQADLLDGFEVRFRERGGEGRVATFVGDRARVFIEHGRLVAASSDDVVTLDTTAGRFRGQGFSLDVRTGAFELKRDLEGELKDVALLGRTGDPLHFSAKGPLKFTASRPCAPGEFFVKEGRLVLDGGVLMSQAQSRLEGSRFEGEIRGTPANLEQATLQGPVVAELPEGKLYGTRATWDASAAPGGRLTLFGAPLRATLADGTRFLPGTVAAGDLELESSSHAIIDGLVGDALTPRKIEVGNDIVLRAPDTLITGRQLRIFLRRIAANDAEAKATATREFPSRIELEGPLEGRGPLGRFAGRLLTFNRNFDEQGMPLLDTIDLSGTPSVSYSFPAPLAAAAVPVSRLDQLGLFEGEGRFEVGAADHIRIVRDPLRVQPLSAEAVGLVVMRRFGPDAKAEAIGTFRAERAAVQLVEDWIPVDGGARFEVKRRISRGSAEGSLEAEVPGLFRGRGHRLEFDGTALSATLSPETEGRVSLSFQDETGQWHDLSAGGLRLLDLASEVHAQGLVRGKTWLAPVRIQEPPPAAGVAEPLVATYFEGLEARLIFETDASTGSRKRVIHQVHGEGDVRVSQDGRLEGRCAHVEIDRLLKSVHLVGTPATFALTELVEGRPGITKLEAPSVTALPDQLLVRGPFTADFPVEAGTLAIDLGAPAQRSGTVPALSSLKVVAAGNLLAAPETWIVKGPATVTLGDPARDGFQVVGERIVLFPAPTAGAPPKLTAKFTKALVEGKVAYRSADFSGDGDVMEFDRERKQIELWSLADAAVLNLPKIGLRDYRRPAFRVNFSDPNRPFFDSIARPERSAPR